jgi:hypothetical protein
MACTISHATQQPCAAPGVSAQYAVPNPKYSDYSHVHHQFHATQQPGAALGVSVESVVETLDSLVPGAVGVHGVHHQSRRAAALRRTWGEC